MDAIKKESRLLSEICCGIGLLSSQRKRNIQSTDCLVTMANMLNVSKVFTKTIIICGSKSEGIYPYQFGKYTVNDMDVMNMLANINVQEHVDTTHTKEAEVFQMLYTDSPEHVLLEVNKRACNTFIVRKHSKYLVSSRRLKDYVQGCFTNRASYFQSVPASNVNDLRNSMRNALLNSKMTIHGPAVMTEPIPASRFNNMDHVFCLRCYEWPTTAHEWIDRARPHGWPSHDLIDQIMYDGCELVPVGRKDHPDEDVQWKLSFSRAETRLIRKFNIYQAQCYQLLKIVKQYYISSVVEDSLSSYHIKTVMLHTVEKTDPEVWRRDNLAQCFMMCLSNLKRYLTDKFLPQYFIVKQNLLEPRVTGDVHQQVLEIVTDLDKIGWKCVLQCPPLLTWCCLTQERGGIVSDVYALAGNMGIVAGCCSSLLSYMLRPEKTVSYFCYLIKSVFFSEQTFLNPTIHESVETARVLQLLRKGELGILLTVIWKMAHPDLRPGIEPMMHVARQCLEESCHADVSSCRLKLATFDFYLGEYDRCITTVQDVLERFKDVWFVAGRRPELNGLGKEQSKLEFKLIRVLQLTDNGFPFISNHVSLPTFFIDWEVAVAPKGVHFLHETMPHSKVCIDSIVYAHYLLVESYLKIDENDNAEHALINMKESIHNGNDDICDRNCLCFYEEDILLFQYSESLMQDAKKARDELKSEHEDV